MAKLRVYEPLRYVEAMPFSENGDHLYYIHDPMEIAAEPLIISPLEYYVAALFNGRNTAEDIRTYLFENLRGLSIQHALIDQVYDQLDSRFYINNTTFRRRAKEVRNQFAASPVRRAWHAGSSYEADPERLHRQISSFYLDREGAGLPAHRKPRQTDTEDPLIAIMAPHIDLRVGAPIYTHPYRCLAESSDADLFVILGVAHMGAENLFVATKKDFETPLGRVSTDTEFIDQWSEHAGLDLTAGEFVHRTEHSVEFQLPFLQHAIKRPFNIVPVLCGSIEPFIRQGRRPEENPEVAAMIEGLRRLISDPSRNVVVILSVDLAHMGPKFGDEMPITERDRESVRASDMEMFDAVGQLDMQAYLQLMRDDLFERKVDACSTIYVMMSMIQEGKGEVLSYGQNLQSGTRSLVSYGSMAFRGRI